ncbi:MAG: bifunctional precorrin-2 dehydrogenase/sirohydrochlorin ferrochelatase [Candidatus Omnitrophota bacterium]
MKLYPIVLKLKNQACLVIGGGEVALRKVKALLECEAKVTVVSPKLCKALEVLQRKKLFNYKKSVYKKEFLKNVFLVIAATSERDTNLKIAAAAQKNKILVNVVDVPQLCSFYVPATVRKEPLLIAISTQGAFPGAAKMIRKNLQPMINKKAGSIKILAKIRDNFKQKIMDKKIRGKYIKKLMDPKIVRLVEQGKIKDYNDLKKFLNFDL